VERAADLTRQFSDCENFGALREEIRHENAFHAFN